MRVDEMNKDQLTRAIISIIAAKPIENTAGALIIQKLNEIMKSMRIEQADAIEVLADLGSDYGKDGELGGINVYVNNAAQFTRLTFTNASESTEITTHLNLSTLIIINGYDKNPPMRFEPDWWLIDGSIDESGIPRIFGYQ